MDTIKKLLQEIKDQQTTKEKISTDKQYPHEKILKAFLRRLNHIAQERGKEYVIDDQNAEVIELLVRYFNNDTEFEKYSNKESQPYSKDWSLRKGIWLGGNYGTGKTMLLDAFKMEKGNIDRCDFGSKSCDEMNTLFLKDQKQYDGIYKYSKKATEGGKVLNYFFDDLGEEEPTVNSFGNKVCVMAYVLGERYRNFVMHGNITHITTNKRIGDVKDYYGGRIDSRVHEMFNIIILGGSKDSKDRRK